MYLYITICKQWTYLSWKFKNCLVYVQSAGNRRSMFRFRQQKRFRENTIGRHWVSLINLLLEMCCREESFVGDRAAHTAVVAVQCCTKTHRRIMSKNVFLLEWNSRTGSKVKLNIKEIKQETYFFWSRNLKQTEYLIPIKKWASVWPWWDPDTVLIMSIKQA